MNDRDGTTQAGPTERFGAWSASFYSQPQVAETALALQDRYGADVNLVFLCLWCAAERRRPLTAGEIDMLDATIAGLRATVLRPLRGLRRKMKEEGEDELYQALKAAEMEAERASQRRLINALPRLAQGDADVMTLAVGSIGALRETIAGLKDAEEMRTLISLYGHMVG